MWIRRWILLALCLLAAVTGHAQVQLTAEFLTGQEGLAAPVSMSEYSPATAAQPDRPVFSGTLSLATADGATGFAVLRDYFGRQQSIGDALGTLPDVQVQLVQRGADIIALGAGFADYQHPYWSIAFQPGRVWLDPNDSGWKRVSMPFALRERGANCTHNGVLTWLFRGQRVSRAAYQVSSETCGYLKLDLWGVVVADFQPQALEDAASGHFLRLDAQRSKRLETRPLEQLGRDYPGVDGEHLGVADGLPPDDISVLGLVVDGVNYRSECRTRAGPYPFCAELALPSFSTAKSIFAGVATMRMERLYPGFAQRTIASLIPQCRQGQWADVTVGNALDMATGNYRSALASEDEYSESHTDFIFNPAHLAKLKFACNAFKRRDKPGQRFVYHTSDTYLVGVGLENFYRQQGQGQQDVYRALMMPLWQSLGLSPLLDESVRTRDARGQAYTGYGLNYTVDDMIRVAHWLTAGAQINGTGVLDEAMLEAALQRNPSDRGLPAGGDDLRYNNGFWAYNAGPSLGCQQPQWVPFMSGVGGISVVMFANGVIYYYFTDSYIFRWQSAREAAQRIKPLCQ